MYLTTVEWNMPIFENHPFPCATCANIVQAVRRLPEPAWSELEVDRFRAHVMTQHNRTWTVGSEAISRYMREQREDFEAWLKAHQSVGITGVPSGSYATSSPAEDATKTG
jgi:hypothetical protein